MKHFAELINALESTNKTNAKIDAIIDYFDMVEKIDDKDVFDKISTDESMNQRFKLGDPRRIES